MSGNDLASVVVGAIAGIGVTIAARWIALLYGVVTACVVAACVVRWRAMGEDERARAKFVRRAKRNAGKPFKGA